MYRDKDLPSMATKDKERAKIAADTAAFLKKPFGEIEMLEGFHSATNSFPTYNQSGQKL